MCSSSTRRNSSGSAGGRGARPGAPRVGHRARRRRALGGSSSTPTSSAWPPPMLSTSPRTSPSWTGTSGPECWRLSSSSNSTATSSTAAPVRFHDAMIAVADRRLVRRRAGCDASQLVPARSRCRGVTRVAKLRLDRYPFASARPGPPPQRSGRRLAVARSVHPPFFRNNLSDGWMSRMRASNSSSSCRRPRVSAARRPDAEPRAAMGLHAVADGDDDVEVVVVDLPDDLAIAFASNRCRFCNGCLERRVPLRRSARRRVFGRVAGYT